MPRQSLPSYVESHPTRGQELDYDLSAEVNWLKSHLSEDHERAGQTLVKEGALNVVLTAMRHGAALGNHAAPGPATILVVEGRVRMHIGDRVTEAGPGGLVAFDAHVSHDVIALEDSAILITIAYDAKARQQA